MSGNVFMIAFYDQGFEAIVNLTALDQQYIMSKMTDEKLPQSVNSIINLTTMRARYNQERNMEVWLVKLDEEFTEEGLTAMAEEDPQAVANIARMGEHVYGNWNRTKKKLIE